MRIRIYINTANVLRIVLLRGKKLSQLAKQSGLSRSQFYAVLSQKHEVKDGKVVKRIIKFLPGAKWDDLFLISRDTTTSAP